MNDTIFEKRFVKKEVFQKTVQKTFQKPFYPQSQPWQTDEAYFAESAICPLTTIFLCVSVPYILF